MDLCSPHVIIRLLAAVGVALFVSGLYLTDVSHSQYDAVVEYNAQVKAWKDTYMQQFLGARFQVEVQAPGAPRFQVELQDFVDTRAWSIPQGYRPELELSPYTPAQFIHTVQPVDIVGGDKHTEYLQRPVNVTLVASSQGNSSVGEQLLHAGEVTIVSQWPSSHCAQAAAASAESCSVLRAVVRFCFVVSYQGDGGASNRSGGVWSWRPSHKGCYGNRPQDRRKGLQDWVLAKCPLEERQSGRCPDDANDRPAPSKGMDLAGRYDLEFRVLDDHDPYYLRIVIRIPAGILT